MQHIKRVSIYSPLTILALVLVLMPVHAEIIDAKNPELRSFIETVSQKHQLDLEQLNQLFAQVRHQQEVIRLISKPYEAKPWYQYHPIFVNDKRAKEGAIFWQENAALLEQAYQKYGVEPEIIVAILGVETRYGRFTGNFPVLDSLTTLAFGYPKRSAFFKKELESYLLLTQEEAIDPTTITGSYAGAMGKSQFMPSSYRHYAVDFDQDGKRSLFNSTADAVGSIANYFKQHGWKTNSPVAVPFKPTTDIPNTMVATISPPKTVLSDILKHGDSANDMKNSELLANVLEFEQPDATEYWLGFNNFYVITRYNRSSLYAMSVHLLSQQIKAHYNEMLNASAPGEKG